MSVTISIDAMGGDGSPGKVVDGLAMAAKKHKDVQFLLVGIESQLKPLLGAHSHLQKNVTVIHADEVVTNDMKVSHALRNSKRSSVRLAIQAVKDGHADGVVSAGNTGAYMALSKILLKTLDGIDRPAITAILPSAKGDIAALDLGANVEGSVENLIQFSLMGEVFARYVMGKKDPSVGLLNVGTEDLKGHSAIREAGRILKESDQLTDFYGFVEGDDVSKGTTDVVVTDGFTGNVMLKSIEGTAMLLKDYFKHTLMRSWAGRIGMLFALRALKQVRRRFDPRRYNGAILFGINGIVVKSHGATDAYGFNCAINVAVQMAKNKVNEHIREGLAHLQEGGLSSFYDDSIEIEAQLPDLVAS